MKVFCKNCRYYHFDPDLCYPKYRNTGSDVHSCCNCPNNIRSSGIIHVTDKYISVPSIINSDCNCRWFTPKSKLQSYVWDSSTKAGKYSEHGEGTFNVNPDGGAAGFYIGDKSLKDLIDESSGSGEAVQELKVRVDGHDEALSELAIRVENATIDETTVLCGGTSTKVK